MKAHPRSVSAAALIVALLSVAPAFGEPFRLERQFDLAAGDRFTLVSDVGGVALRGVAGHQASIVVTSDREDLAERCAFRFEPGAGQLEMVVECKERGARSWFRQFRGNAHIAIEVPRATPVDLQTAGGGIDVSALDASVKANSSGGGVKVAGVHGPVRLESSGGGVRAESIDGPVFADTSGGSLTIEAVSGDVEASSSGGGVQIQGAGGRVKASSSGGPVRVTFAAGNSKGGDLDSSGGGVVATVDSAAGIDVDAESSGGSVHCDLPVTLRGRISGDSLHAKLNGGGALLRLRSSGGGISINPR